MPVYDAVSGAGTLRLSITDVSEDIAGNFSTVAWSLELFCGNGASFNTGGTGWSVNIGGATASGSYVFDFRSSTSKLIAGGNVNIAHDPDGTKTLTASGHSDHTGTSAIGGPIDTGGSGALNRIPRGPKVEVSGAWQQSICYVEVSGVWQTAICYVEQGGAWVQAA